MRYLSLILLGVFLLSSGCVRSADRDRISVDNWEICLSETSDPDVVEKREDWRPINTPGLFKNPWPPVRGFRFVWLKAEAIIESPDQWYGIRLGRVYFLDRVFLNGKPIGSHMTEEFQEFHYPRFYRFPDGGLKKGRNEILVYLGIYGREFGGISGSVELLQKKDFFSQRTVEMLVFRQLPISIMFLFTGFLLVIMLFYVPGARDYPALVSMGILLVWICHLFTIFSPWQFMSIDFRTSVLWSSSYLAALLFFLYVQSYYRIYLVRINRVYAPALLVFFISTMVFQDTTSPFYPGRIFGVINLAAVTIVHVYLLYLITRRKPGNTIVVFWLLGFLPGISIGVDIINYLYIDHIPPLYHVYTIPVMIFMIFFLHKKKMSEQEEKLLKMTQALELFQKKEEKPERPKKSDKPDRSEETYTITGAMEEKLNNLVAYLNDHFTDSFTRDELSSKMGLSKDYMSRMFKVFTGKKMNEYVNELRIRMACSLLVETDNTITDIAFSVGFESLATFNRSFTRITGHTPGKYRQTNCK